jgi:hypothetical protein
MRQPTVVGVVLVAALVAGCSDDGGVTTAAPSTTSSRCDRDVEVYVVVERIPAGTTGDVAFANGWIAQNEIAAEFRPGGSTTPTRARVRFPVVHGISNTGRGREWVDRSQPRRPVSSRPCPWPSRVRSP